MPDTNVNEQDEAPDPKGASGQKDEAVKVPPKKPTYRFTDFASI